ncbi:MAG TPA: hypothetical protein VK524_05500 [Polyangiaceae bacterium]|nr:hypothetical protein [Polyangiaceae bacterium]
MPAPSAPTKDASPRILVVVFTVVMGSFVLTTLAVQRASSEVDTLSDRIVWLGKSGLHGFGPPVTWPFSGVAPRSDEHLRLQRQVRQR